VACMVLGQVLGRCWKEIITGRFCSAMGPRHFRHRACFRGALLLVLLSIAWPYLEMLWKKMRPAPAKTVAGPLPVLIKTMTTGCKGVREGRGGMIRKVHRRSTQLIDGGKERLLHVL